MTRCPGCPAGFATSRSRGASGPSAAAPALIGFDDFELADLLGVSVVSHTPEDMGELGAELLLDRLDGGGNPGRSKRLPVRLIERGSGERPPAAVGPHGDARS